jgi:hypothetical protein
VTAREPAAGPPADAVNRLAEAALGWAELLPGGGVAKSSAPPVGDPEGATTPPPPVAIAPAVETADVVVLDSTVVTEGVVVGFGTAVVTCGRVVVTCGRVVVTFGTAVVTGRVVVTLGMVVVTGSVVVTLGSVVDTGSVVEIGGSVVVIVTCGTAERPGMAVLVRRPRRRTTASAAARFTSYDIPDPRLRNPSGWLRCVASGQPCNDLRPAPFHAAQ